MDIILSLLAVLTGIIVRLALPIGITALAIFFLRKLDARWQVDAAQQNLSVGVEKPNCWEKHNCASNVRESCPGYKSTQPCWQAFRKGNGYLQERCLGCDVFISAPLPVHS